MHYEYCPKCGKKLEGKKAGDDGLVPFCDHCDAYWFDTFSDCVIVLTYNEFDEVVLARQGYLSDKYASFTSGFMEMGENAEETALREVKEELGLDLTDLEYAGTYWFDAKDMLMHGFIGYSEKKEFNLSEEIDSAEWVPAVDAPKYMFPDGPGNSAYAIFRKFLEKKNLPMV